MPILYVLICSTLIATFFVEVQMAKYKRKKEKKKERQAEKREKKVKKKSSQRKERKATQTLAVVLGEYEVTH